MGVVAVWALPCKWNKNLVYFIGVLDTFFHNLLKILY